MASAFLVWELEMLCKTNEFHENHPWTSQDGAQPHRYLEFYIGATSIFLEIWWKLCKTCGWPHLRCVKDRHLTPGEGVFFKETIDLYKQKCRAATPKNYWIFIVFSRKNYKNRKAFWMKYMVFHDFSAKSWFHASATWIPWIWGIEGLEKSYVHMIWAAGSSGVHSSTYANRVSCCSVPWASGLRIHTKKWFLNALVSS